MKRLSIIIATIASVAALAYLAPAIARAAGLTDAEVRTQIRGAVDSAATPASLLQASNVVARAGLKTYSGTNLVAGITTNRVVSVDGTNAITVVIVNGVIVGIQ